MKVTKETIISDVLNIDINTAEIFLRAGMYCIVCPAAQGESVEEACYVHGVDPDQIVDILNEYLENAQTAETSEA